MIGKKSLSTSFAWNKIGSCSREHREVIAKLAVDTKGFQTEGEKEMGVVSVNNKMNENAAVF